MMKYLVFFGIIAAVFVTGESLKCYECYNEKCQDKSELKNLVNCTTDTKFCFKQIINEQVDKKVLVNRGCFSVENVNKKINMTNTISTEVFFCDKDSCNSVGSFTASLSIVFVTLVALMFASERW